MRRHPRTMASRAVRSRSVRFDNLALVPASLLPYKAPYQAIANKFPRGGVLICLPQKESRQPSASTLLDYACIIC